MVGCCKRRKKEEVGTEGQREVHRGLKRVSICSKVIFDRTEEVVNGCNAVQNGGRMFFCYMADFK